MLTLGLNPWLLLGAALGALTLAAGGFYEGVKHQQGVDARATLVVAQEQVRVVTDAAIKARMDQAAADKITLDAAVAGAQAQVKIVTRTITQVKEVPKFVSVESNKACTVPLGFVRLTNSAAGGTDTDPGVSFAPGESADTPAAADLATIAATTVQNYGACNGFRAQLTQWQDWWRAQAAAWPK